MPNPVILVHGIKDDARKMARMAKYLRTRGHVVWTFSFKPSCGKVGIEVLAEQLSNYVNGTIGVKQKIDLVGFSMGGLVCRYYVQRLGGLSRVERLITLSSPHHGTWMAYIIRNPGSIQMRPGSEFLTNLDNDMGELRKIKCASIWTPFDLMILPASSSRIEFGRNIIIWILLHPLMVYSKKSLQIIEAELAR